MLLLIHPDCNCRPWVTCKDKTDLETLLINIVVVTCARGQDVGVNWPIATAAPLRPPAGKKLQQNSVKLKLQGKITKSYEKNLHVTHVFAHFLAVHIS